MSASKLKYGSFFLTGQTIYTANGFLNYKHLLKYTRVGFFFLFVCVCCFIFQEYAVYQNRKVLLQMNCQQNECKQVLYVPKWYNYLNIYTTRDFRVHLGTHKKAVIYNRDWQLFEHWK